MTLWDENAVAVERREGENVIIGEGTLASLAAALQCRSARTLTNVGVYLPDRRVRPFSFVGGGLMAVIKHPDRPKVIPSELLPPPKI